MCRGGAPDRSDVMPCSAENTGEKILGMVHNTLSQSQEVKGEIVVPMTGEQGSSMFFIP